MLLLFCHARYNTILDTILHFSVHQPIGQSVYVCANKTKKGCLSQASVHADATTGTLSVFPDCITAQQL